MLDLVSWYRKVSFIGLIAVVLTPFVFRPVLNMVLHAHQETLFAKASTQPSSAHHRASNCIVQNREGDKESQKPFQLLAKMKPNQELDELMMAGMAKGLMKAFNKSTIPATLFVIFTSGGIDFVGGYSYY